jgi:FkbM family methyltransferase
MNFSKIHYRSFLGKLVRMPLRLIPKKMKMPIIQGTLRGKKWIVGSGEHGYWLGSYEMGKRIAFEKEILPGSVIYDIGANVGFYSLLAAELTGEKGQVYAFEPLPRNIKFLIQHVQINRYENIKIIEAAVSDHEGDAYFDLGASTAMGHLSQGGELKVNVVRLDEMLARGEILPPDYMKIDVEGAEFDVIQGSQNILETYHPTLFLDTHNRTAHQQALIRLEQLGYQITILDGKSLAETREVIAKFLI